MEEVDPQDLARERRLLLRNLLESLRENGAQVLLPVGCDGSEAWLLDRVDAAAVLEAGRRGEPIDVALACGTRSGGGGAAPSTPPTSPRGGVRAGAGGGGGARPGPLSASVQRGRDGGEPARRAPAEPAAAKRAARPVALPFPLRDPGTSVAGGKEPATGRRASSRWLRLGGTKGGGSPAPEAPAGPPSAESSASGVPTPTLSARSPRSLLGEEDEVLPPDADRGGLDAAQLADLALQCFLGTAGGEAGAELLGVLCSQLAISPGRLNELTRVLASSSPSPAAGVRAGEPPVDAARGGPGGLRPLVLALREVRPADFSGFAEFVSWRDGAARALWAGLGVATRYAWAGDPDCRGDEGPGELGGASGGRKLLARLGGALRRMDVRDPEEYDGGEYGEAAEAAATAAGEIARLTTSGWSLPWSLRSAVAARLLRAVFDLSTPGTYTAHCDELVTLLKQQTWPALGVEPSLHLALYAAAHAAEARRAGEPRMLDSAHAVLKALPPRALRRAAAAAGLVDAPPPPAEGGPGAAAGPAAEGRDADPAARADALDSSEGVAALVLARMSEGILVTLSDYHSDAVDPTHIPRMLALLQTAERALGRSHEVPRELAECIRASVAAEFQRRAARVLREAGERAREKAEEARRARESEAARGGQSAREARVAAAAEAAAAARAPKLNGEQTSAAVAALAAEATRQMAHESRAFSPLLAPLFPEAREAAAAELHGLLGARVLPWAVRLAALDAASVSALRACERAEAGLLADAGARAAAGSDRDAAGGTRPPALRKWRLADRATPLLDAWAADRARTLRDWAGRLLCDEDWGGPGEGEGGGGGGGGGGLAARRRGPRYARAAIEALSACEESLDAAFALGLDLPAGSARILADGMDEALADVAAAAASGLGSRAALRPEPPALTRFKREDAAASEAAEAQRLLREGLGRLAGGPACDAAGPFGVAPKSALVAAVASLERAARKGATSGPLDGVDGGLALPPAAGTPGGRLLAVGPSQLSCRANSAQRLLDGASALDARLRALWTSQRAERARRLRDTRPPAADAPAAAAAGGGGEAAPAPAAPLRRSGSSLPPESAYDVQSLDWAAGILGGCRRRAAEARDEVLACAAAQLVLGELRAPIFRDLWRWRPRASRLGPLALEPLDAMMGDLCTRLDPALPARLAAAVGRELAVALHAVLLDGGPARLFALADCDTIEDDLDDCRAMLRADGDGLPQRESDAILAPVDALVDLMRSPTDALLASHREALRLAGGTSARAGSGPLSASSSARGARPSDPPSSRPASDAPDRAALRARYGRDPDVLLRVLCHRADHTASKALKVLKVPKKLPGAGPSVLSGLGHGHAGGNPASAHLAGHADSPAQSARGSALSARASLARAVPPLPVGR